MSKNTLTITTKANEYSRLPVLANVCPRYDAQNLRSRISLGESSSESSVFSSRLIRARKFFHSSAHQVNIITKDGVA